MLVIHVITSLNVGGAERALLRLLSNRTSDDVVVISLTDKGIIGQQLEAEGITVYSIGMTCFNLPFRLVQLVLLIKDLAPDVVQTWLYHADFFGGICARLAGVKNIIWGIRTTKLPHKAYTTSVLRCVLAALSYFLPTKIVSVADSSKRYHIELGYDKSKFIVIPNGFEIDVSCCSASAASNAEPIIPGTDSLVVGTVGRYSIDKGYDVFVDSAAHVHKSIPEVLFVMVGRGYDEDNAELVKLIADKGLRQNFVLLGQRNDVQLLLHQFDIFCLPSRTEGFPNALVEAMLASVPCVSTRVGDAVSIGGEGVIYSEPDAPQNLASNLIQLLSFTEPERRRIGAELQQRAIHKFSIAQMVRSYDSLYTSLKDNEI